MRQARDHVLRRYGAEEHKTMRTFTAAGTLIGFAGFICSFHCALCSAIFCVAQAAETPIASVTLAVPVLAIPYSPHKKPCAVSNVPQVENATQTQSQRTVLLLERKPH